MKTEPVKEEEKKKKKKKPRIDRTSERRRRRKKRTEQPTQEKKEKKVKRLSKGAAKYCLWVPYVCLITILSLSYELWKQSYRNRVMDYPNNLFAMGSTIFEL